MHLWQELLQSFVLKRLLVCSGFNYVRRFFHYNMFSIFFLCQTNLFTFSSFLVAWWLVATLSIFGRNSLILRDDDQIVFLLPVLCKTSLLQDGGTKSTTFITPFFWTQLFQVFLTSTFSKTFWVFLQKHK